MKLNKINSKFEFRDYQNEAIQNLERDMSNGINRCLIQIPTGGGKTPLLADLAKKFACNGKKVLIITPRRNLVEQTIRYFDKGNSGILSSSFREDNFNEQVSIIVATTATLLKRELLVVPQLVIIDEVHFHCDMKDGSKVQLRKLIEKLSPEYLVGYTATPVRKKHSIISSGKWHLSFEISMEELTRKKYLTPIKQIAVGNSDKNNSKPLSIDEMTEKIVECVTPSLIKEDRKRIIVFCKDQKHCKIAMQLFVKKGWDANMVISEQSQKKNDKLLASFSKSTQSDPKPKILINCSILGLGIDIPEADAAILMKSFVSIGALMQAIGRIARLSNNKHYACLYSFSSSLARRAKLSMTGGADFLKPFPLKVCNCGHLNLPQARLCPICNFEFQFKIKLQTHSTDSGIIDSKVKYGLIESITQHTTEKGISKWVLVVEGSTIHCFSSSAINKLKIGDGVTYEIIKEGFGVLL